MRTAHSLYTLCRNVLGELGELNIDASSSVGQFRVLGSNSSFSVFNVLKLSSILIRLAGDSITPPAVAEAISDVLVEICSVGKE